MAEALRAVVFDIGNVLFDWDIRALYAPLIPDPARLDWFCREVVTADWHFAHDAGVAFADNAAALIERFPAEAGLIRAYGPRFNESIIGPMPGMLELVAELAAAAVPLFAITNFSAEFWGPFRATQPVFDLFADIIVSGEERMVKPDAAIYQLALRRFGLAPGTALFVDDRLDNVEAADANGMVGHLFQDAATLKSQMRAHGLL